MQLTCSEQIARLESCKQPSICKVMRTVVRVGVLLQARTLTKIHSLRIYVVMRLRKHTDGAGTVDMRNAEFQISQLGGLDIDRQALTVNHE